MAVMISVMKNNRNVVLRRRYPDPLELIMWFLAKIRDSDLNIALLRHGLLTGYVRFRLDTLKVSLT